MTALFHHVAAILADEPPIPMDDLIGITFDTELGTDAIFRGSFTIVFSPDTD